MVPFKNLIPQGILFIFIKIRIMPYGIVAMHFIQQLFFHTKNIFLKILEVSRFKEALAQKEAVELENSGINILNHFMINIFELEDELVHDCSKVEMHEEHVFKKEQLLGNALDKVEKAIQSGDSVRQQAYGRALRSHSSHGHGFDSPGIDVLAQLINL